MWERVAQDPGILEAPAQPSWVWSGERSFWLCGGPFPSGWIPQLWRARAGPKLVIRGGSKSREGELKMWAQIKAS